MNVFYVIFALIGLTPTASGSDFDLYQVFTPEKFCKAVERTKISPVCQRQLKESCDNQTVLNWMIDAMSKYPFSGIDDGRNLDLGDYKECVRIRHSYDDDEIIGKHCIYGLILLLHNNTDTLFLSSCIPKVCSGQDFNTIFGDIVFEGFPGSFSDSYCSTNEPKPLTTTAVIALLIFTVCIIFMVFCSCYDYYLQKNSLDCSNKLFIAFSVITNGKNLFKTMENSKDNILIFQGFRIISTIWIIFGHGGETWKNLPLINQNEYLKMNDLWYSFYIRAYFLTVDTFFYMTGFLLAYNYLKNKKISIRNHLKAVPGFLIHRYLRIAPPVIMLYFLMAHLFIYCTDGPYAVLGNEVVTQGCEPENIWQYFLFLQNYKTYPCVGATWYLSVDMQIYFLSPIVLIPLCLILNKKGFRSSMIFLFAVNFIVLIIPTAIGFYQTESTYSETPPRLITVFCGVMMGTFMREKRKEPFFFEKFKGKNQIINMIGWIIFMPLMFLIIYFYVDHIKEAPVNSILVRPIWCMGLSWMVYACYHGYGGLVNWILTLPILQVGGNLSYSLYLIQTFTIYYFYNTVQTTKYFSNLEMNYFFWDQFVIDIFLAMFWYLAFEAPTGVLEKILFDTKFMSSIGLSHRRTTKPANNNA